MAKSYQFCGKESLIEGFENTKAKSWSIWEDKDLLTKGVGSDTLETFLNALEKGSATIYRLKIYNKIDDDDEIKDTTPADGSFRFILTADKYDLSTNDQYYNANKKNRLFERLEKIESTQQEIIGQLNNGPEVEGEEEIDMSVGGIVKYAMQKPDEMLSFVNMCKAIMGIPIQQMPPTPARPAIGNIQQQTTPMNQPASNTIPSQEVDYAEKARRAQIAINTLEKDNPHLVEQLEKLARIKTQQPTQWNFLLSLLNNMQ